MSFTASAKPCTGTTTIAVSVTGAAAEAAVGAAVVTSTSCRGLVLARSRVLDHSQATDFKAIFHLNVVVDEPNLL